MGWMFWKREKSDAERSLETLQAAAANPTRNASPTGGGDFRLVVEDVFSITGRGTVVTGQVAAGTVSVGMPVSIATADGTLETKVTDVEMFRKLLHTATTGDNVGLLLAKVDRDRVHRGDTITG